jgi:glycosyltransferase involved in cell wall biosynthesis
MSEKGGDWQMADKNSEELRVLRVSHSAVASAYRERERALVSKFPVEILLIMPEHWPLLGAQDNYDVPEPFKFERIGILGAGSVPLHVLYPPPIIRALRDFKPHIVDIHEEPYSAAGFECSWLASQLAPEAACVFYTAQNIRKRYPPPFSWTERFVYRHCKGAYPCSSGALETLRQKGFSKTASVIPLGIDPTLFRSRQLMEGERAERGRQLGIAGFVVGFFGRVEQYKGIVFLLEAMAKVGDSFDWTLMVVGNGQFQSKAEQICRHLKIEDRIRWLGARPGSEMPLLLSLCDVIVTPSLTTKTWKEQFGRVVVEAMACGVPVITSDSGSLPDLTKGAGLIVPEGDALAIADKLMTLYRDQDLRADLSTRGMKLVTSEYTWDSVAQQMFDLYTAVLKAG